MRRTSRLRRTFTEIPVFSQRKAVNQMKRMHHIPSSKHEKAHHESVRAKDPAGCNCKCDWGVNSRSRDSARTTKLVAGERVAALGGGNLDLVLAIVKSGGGAIGLLPVFVLAQINSEL